MKVGDLKNDLYIKEWLLNIKVRPSTVTSYLQGMQNYTDVTGRTARELIEEAEDEIQEGILPRRRKIKSYMLALRQYYLDKGLADNSIRARTAGVKSFYNSYEIPLPSLMGEREHARTLERNKAIPTKEDLQAALKVCDPLERAVMLVGISSGLSSNEIKHLTLSDFYKDYDPETLITTLDLRRKKEGVDFITFLSPEATKAINDYIQFRNRTPKNNTPRRLSQLEKQRVTLNEKGKPSGYLFILRNVPADYLKTKNEEMRQLTDVAVSKIYRSISEKSNQNTERGTFNVIRSHNMRKYYVSAMRNAGADDFFVEYTSGHTIDATRAAYFRASPEKLRDIYARYVPYLNVMPESDFTESPEFQKMKTENETLAREAVRATVERSELQDIRVELEKLKELTNFTNFILSTDTKVNASTYKAVLDAKKEKLGLGKLDKI